MYLKKTKKNAENPVKINQKWKFMSFRYFWSVETNFARQFRIFENFRKGSRRQRFWAKDENWRSVQKDCTSRRLSFLEKRYFHPLLLILFLLPFSLSLSKAETRRPQYPFLLFFLNRNNPRKFGEFSFISSFSFSLPFLDRGKSRPLLPLHKQLQQSRKIIVTITKKKSQI